MLIEHTEKSSAITITMWMSEILLMRDAFAEAMGMYTGDDGKAHPTHENSNAVTALMDSTYAMFKAEARRAVPGGRVSRI